MNITQAIIAAALLLPAQIQAADTLQTTVAAKPASWTLRSCIDYAKQNNVTVRKNKVNAQSARLDLANAKAGRLPTVSASTSQQGSYAPFRKTSAVVNGSQVMSTGSKWTYSGNYGLEASMPVFDGGTTKNNIKLAEINSQIADLTADASMLTIEEQITNLYVQILYAKETVNEDEEQIKLSETNLARTQEFYRNGLLAQADVSQIESQLATDRYQKVADETTLNQYRLQLKQLLEISDDEKFDIATTSIDGDVLAMLPATSQVYNTALALRPEIQAGKLAMQKSDLDVKIAKAAWYPHCETQCRLERDQHERQRQLDDTAQAELEQLCGREREHPHLRRRQDQKQYCQGPVGETELLSRPARDAEVVVEHHRHLSHERLQRPAALCGRQGECQLCPHEL